MSKNRRVKRPGRPPKKPSPSPATIQAKSAERDGEATLPSREPRVKRPKRPSSGGPSREIVGIMLLGATIFVIAASFSLQIGSGLFMGPLGRTTASAVYGFAGLCSYLLACACIGIAVRLLMERLPVLRVQEVAGVVLGVASLATLLHLLGDDYRVQGHGPGGVIGEHIAEVLRAVVSTAGTALLAVTGLVIAAVVATPLRMREVGTHLGRGARFLWAGICHAAAAVGHFCGEVIRAILPEREHDEYLDDDEYDDEHAQEYSLLEHDESELGAYDPPIIETTGAVPQPVLDGHDTERVDQRALAQSLAREIEPRQNRAGSKTATTAQTAFEAAPEAMADDHDTEIAAPAPLVSEADPAKPSTPAKKSRKKPPALVVDEPVEATAAEEAELDVPATELGPVIVESEFMSKDKPAAHDQPKQGERLDFIPLGEGQYQLPSVSLLDYDQTERASLDRESMLELSARLTKTLENYGVRGEVVAIRPGPVVTMYEFAPAPGIRINKITNLSDDLAMALEALSVRIVAPIPGKAAVGIEVPNRSRETVFLEELIRDEVFQKGRHKLPLALGKNIEGAPEVVDLAKMPHLLVAGTTGSGKSVSVNSMILSLLYSRTPEEVRMIMVDPKMLELSIYEGIPHLLLPVVTDPKKANLALRWGVEEMERRYELLAKMGVRDLSGYNKKVAKMQAKLEADKLRMAADEAERLADADDFVEHTEERELPRLDADVPEQLPYIVIIIDEFADLMMCAPKEVETSVARIAQKARAAGIHLILATQRPSVDVITGLIKANFPSRAAFRVASKVDSRTILDQGGAEALLGSGDMLFTDRGAAPVRYHGCFVTEEEIARVVEFLSTQGRPVYNLDIIKPRDDDAEEDSGASMSEDSGDTMYDRAVALVAETRQVSISMIQRRLRVGYNRAARMVEEMERQGVVSPPDHTNKREVLISDFAA